MKLNSFEARGAQICHKRVFKIVCQHLFYNSHSQAACIRSHGSPALSGRSRSARPSLPPQPGNSSLSARALPCPAKSLPAWDRARKGEGPGGVETGRPHPYSPPHPLPLSLSAPCPGQEGSSQLVAGSMRGICGPARLGGRLLLLRSGSGGGAAACWRGGTRVA